MKTKISVVSYKRPDNNTCMMLKNTTLDWNVFVYGFDPFLEKYLDKYGHHVRIITQAEIDKANLAKKRQLVIDSAKEEKYTHVIMMDDDILGMRNIFSNEDITIKELKELLERYAHRFSEYTVLSPRYNHEDTNIEIYDGKQMNCVSIIDVQKIDVEYNENSECEDIELCINLLEKGHKIGRISTIQVNGKLQDTSGSSGNSYRYTNAEQNRFIKEGEYLIKRFPQYKDAIIYDETKVKYNYEKLQKLFTN